MKFLVLVLTSFVLSSPALAAEKVDQKALVCATMAGKPYGVVLTLFRTAESEDWYAQAFTQEQRDRYLNGSLQFTEMDIVNGITDFEPDAKNFSIEISEDSDLELYRCSELGFMDTFGAHSHWYQLLNDFQN